MKSRNRFRPPFRSRRSEKLEPRVWKNRKTFEHLKNDDSVDSASVVKQVQAVVVKWFKVLGSNSSNLLTLTREPGVLKFVSPLRKGIEEIISLRRYAAINGLLCIVLGHLRNESWQSIIHVRIIMDSNCGTACWWCPC